MNINDSLNRVIALNYSINEGNCIESNGNFGTWYGKRSEERNMKYKEKS